MKRYHIGILVLVIVTISFLYGFFKSFEEQLENVKTRRDNAEKYIGKSIVLESDTLEVLDYRLGQFMLSDRTWIGEDVVYRKVR